MDDAACLVNACQHAGRRMHAVQSHKVRVHVCYSYIAESVTLVIITMCPFIKNLFPTFSHVHNDIRYLEKENAEVTQLMNAFPSNNSAMNETYSLSLLLFPFVSGEVLPATSSPPHLIVFSTLCILSSSSSLLPLLSSSHLS